MLRDKGVEGRLSVGAEIVDEGDLEVLDLALIPFFLSFNAL